MSAPASVSLDMLGIKIGDTYTQAKAKLDSMAEELGNSGATVEPRERKAFFKLPVGSGQFIETTFVSDIKLDINRYPNQPNGESLEVHFSAPSSGAQAYSIVRTLNYGDNTKQPKISELQARLAKKFGTKPFYYSDHSRRETRLYIVFNDGKAVQGAHIDQPMLGEHCVGLWSDLAGGYTQHNSNSVQKLNRNGDCDVVLTVIFDHGISEDHFTRAAFYLSDFERAKQSIGADYDFFDDYINTLQSTAGESPKL